MNLFLTILTRSLTCALLLTPVLSFAQESGSGNPLRLTAYTPDNTAQTNAPAQTETHSTSAAPANFNIPPEVRQALYPGQRISRPIQVTNDAAVEITTAVSTVQAGDSRSKTAETSRLPQAFDRLPGQQKLPAAELKQFDTKLTSDGVRNLPPEVQVHPQPRVNYPTQPAFHTEPVGVESSTWASSPNETQNRLPRPQNESEISPQPEPHGQTLASLLAESNDPKPGTLKNSKANRGGVDDGTFGLENSDTVLATSEEFQKMLQRIATSTCLVMFLGIGFIIVAKRWVGRRKSAVTLNGGTKPESGAPPRIRVIANLKLNPKSNLQLVEIGDQRVLVASDLNGIKSVTALNQSFTSTLEALDEGADAIGDVTAQTYTPASRAYAEVSNSNFRSSSNTSHSNPAKSVAASSAKPETAKQSTAEIEAEMKKQLAELLGGQAFKDVFYKNNRAVA